MKGSCALVASVVAASTVALTSSADKGKSVNARGASAGKEKYAPTFDGLRFIETLVTAHRSTVDTTTGGIIPPGVASKNN